MPLLTYQWRRFEEAGGRSGWTVLAEGDTTSPPLLPDWVQVVRNPDPDRGPFSSLQIGARAALASGAMAAFLLPLDVPGPTEEVWEALEAAMLPGILAATPSFNQRGGHPVLLSREMLLKIEHSPALSRLDEMLHACDPKHLARVHVDDPGILSNWNTPADVAT